MTRRRDQAAGAPAALPIQRLTWATIDAGTLTGSGITLSAPSTLTSVRAQYVGGTGASVAFVDLGVRDDLVTEAGELVGWATVRGTLTGNSRLFAMLVLHDGTNDTPTVGVVREASRGEPARGTLDPSVPSFGFITSNGTVTPHDADRYTCFASVGPTRLSRTTGTAFAVADVGQFANHDTSGGATQNVNEVTGTRVGVVLYADGNDDIDAEADFYLTTAPTTITDT